MKKQIWVEWIAGGDGWDMQGLLTTSTHSLTACCVLTPTSPGMDWRWGEILAILLQLVGVDNRHYPQRKNLLWESPSLEWTTTHLYDIRKFHVESKKKTNLPALLLGPAVETVSTFPARTPNHPSTCLRLPFLRVNEIRFCAADIQLYRSSMVCDYMWMCVFYCF